MRSGKLLFFICLILIGWYVWHHYLKDTEPAVEFVNIIKSEFGRFKETKVATELLKFFQPQGAPSKESRPEACPVDSTKPDVGLVKDTQPEVEVSAAGFKKVPWISGASNNEVVVIGPG